MSKFLDAGVKMEGVSDLIRAIAHDLPVGMRASVYGSSLRIAMKPLVASARQHAQAVGDTGLLAESIGLKITKSKERVRGSDRDSKLGAATARVGPRGGFKRTVYRARKGDAGLPYEQLADPIRYAHLVEFGTPHSKAKPFMRPALAETRTRVESEMAESLKKGLERVVKAARRKGKI